MKALLLAMVLLSTSGCSALRTATYSPDEQCIDAEILCIDAILIPRYLAYTPKEPNKEDGVIRWSETQFEILTPKEYEGRKITFPIDDESTDYLTARKLYKVRLPLSVIQGKPKYLSYDLRRLERKEANQSPEPTPTTVTPPARQEARQP